MHAWILIPLILSAGGTPQTVKNGARVLDEPKYWAKRVGEVARGESVVVVKDQGAWLQVKSKTCQGYVPKSALVDDAVTDADMAAFADAKGTEAPASAAQASNASRGFSKEANSADVSAAHLEDADHEIARYEAADKDSDLSPTVAAQMPGFLRSGHLLEGER